MIEINNLNYSYANGKKQVFSDFSLTIVEEGVYGLLGKNGVGKSTLLKLMSGLLCPRAGQVSIDGEAACERKARTLSKLYYVPDEIEFPPMSLERYVKLIRPFYPNFSEEVLKNCMDDFELEFPKKLTQLSLGEKKKVALSLAMAANTELVLLDEPTNGLDIPSKTQLRRIVAKCMGEGKVMIVSTHLVHDVEQLLDHVVIIGKECLLLNNTIGELMDEYVFEVAPVGSTDASVLYSEPVAGGELVIRKRENDEPQTEVKLEALFNYVTNKK